MSRIPRGLRIGLGLLLLGLLAVLRPWTIRPIEAPRPAFDATSYVDASWPRVLAEADRTARDAAGVLQAFAAGDGAAGGPAARPALFVKGRGVVTRVELGSRVGQALIRLDGAPAATVAVQIGPVLRGTAVRDAASFIRFTDFANQFDFAAVSNALNDRVLSTVLERIDRQALAGQPVSFVGGATVRGHGTETSLEVTPLVIGVGRGDR
jgi:predicted lipoprotein